MIVLGIDTSAYANSVGLVDGDRVLADRIFEAGTDSLEQIVDNIDSVLKNAGLNLEDIEGVGVGLGPGSWTGIRVGVTVGKMLAFSLSRPLAGIPTLQALAYQARHESRVICSVISAGTPSAVYAAFYRARRGTVVLEGDYFVGDVVGLSRLVREPVTLVGPGALSWREIIYKNLVSGIDVRAVAAVPGAASVARLARERLANGDADDSLALKPLYLKESTARAFSHGAHRYKG